MRRRYCLVLLALGLVAAFPARALESSPQVLIEARVVEVSRAFSRQLGVDWTPLDGLPPASEAGAGVIQGLTLAQDSRGLTQLLDAVREGTDVRLLAEPRLVTADGTRGLIRVGGDLPIPGDEGRSGAELEDFGIDLEFIPHVSPDGTVRMELRTAVDRVDVRPGNRFLGIPAVPELRTRTAAAEVRIPDKGTLVIGGLIQDDERNSARRLRAVDDLPVLGALFAQRAFQNGDLDLWVIITPRVVGLPGDGGGDVVPSSAQAPDIAPAAADARPRQVRIEARVLDLSQDISRQLGIDWNRQGGVPAALALGGGAAPDPALQVLADALGDPGDARVLAEPRVLISDGARASIQVGGDVSIPADEAGSTVQLEDFGIDIDIVPHISAEGTVRLEISTAVDRVDMRAGSPILGTEAVLERHTRTIDTAVDVPSGGTVLLGGLFQEEDWESARRVPALSRVPTLGALFAGGAFQRGERGLVVVMTPRVLTPGEDDDGGDWTPAPALATGPAAGAAGKPRDATGEPTGSAGGRPGANKCLSSGDLQTVSLGSKPSFVERIAKGRKEQMLGGFFGGGVGGGIGGLGGGFAPRFPESSSGGGVVVDPDPFEDLTGARVAFADGMTFELHAVSTLSERVENPDPLEDFGSPRRVTRTPGMTFGVRADRDAVKDRRLTFANLFLLSPDCRKVQPTGRFVYEVWQDRRFRFHIEFWRWRDGQLVEHWTRTGGREWSDMLASGAFPVSLGALFDGVEPQTLARGGWSMVTTWTYEQGDEVFLDPRVFDIWGDQGQKQGAGKVPGLAGLPTLGRLFREQSPESDEPELLLFVSPRIRSDTQR